MAVIDEDGRVFGVVNVIDALVVLVVLSVAVAGVTFVLVGGGGPDDPTETATRYVTLDLGTQETFVAELVSEGDTVSPSDEQSLTVTDVYTTETDGGRYLYARARVEGVPRDEGGIAYAGGPLRVGRDVDLTTPEYETSATVTAVDDGNPDLRTVETDVLLRTTLPADTVEALQTADEYRVAGRTVGTVRSVAAYRTGEPGRVRAYVGVTYLAYRTADGMEFAGTPVREGATLPVETAAYEFHGQVTRRGALAPRGQERTRTVRLEMENVDPDVANGLRAGMRERVRGETVAELTAVTVDPAVVVLTSQDGNVYRREHPVRKDVTMTADLRVRETSAGIRFKGAVLRQGATVVLDLGTVTVEATLVSVQ